MFMRGDRGPDFVQSWFALKWAILLIRIFSKVIAWVVIANLSGSGSTKPTCPTTPLLT
jgi:hypothetical protein